MGNWRQAGEERENGMVTGKERDRQIRQEESRAESAEKGGRRRGRWIWALSAHARHLVMLRLSAEGRIL